MQQCLGIRSSFKKIYLMYFDFMANRVPANSFFFLTLLHMKQEALSSRSGPGILMRAKYMIDMIPSQIKLVSQFFA